MGGMKVKGEEFLWRVNYLYQATNKVAETYPSLARHYGYVLTTISEKTPAKLDFTIKRSICKKCHLHLIPGVNAMHRLQRRKFMRGRPTQVITCTNCKSTKKLPTHRPG